MTRARLFQQPDKSFSLSIGDSRLSIEKAARQQGRGSTRPEHADCRLSIEIVAWQLPRPSIANRQSKIDNL
jgi:hypothetical protein